MDKFKYYSVPFLLLLLLRLQILCVASLPLNISTVPFTRGFTPLFGESNIIHPVDDQSVRIHLNQYTGSGFKSSDLYSHGFFSAKIRLPSDYTAGIVVAFYTTNEQVFRKSHDELDFEFLGNIKGKAWRFQTNMYGNGSTHRGREERYYLWFDPSKEFHTYSILWTTNNIIFYIDDIPIREIVRNEAMGADFPSKPMGLYATIWDASDWATSGGKYKVNYKYAPFVAEFTDLVLHGCASDPLEEVVDAIDCTEIDDQLVNSDLAAITPKQNLAMKRFRSKYMYYSYCYDTLRYPVPPSECVIGENLYAANEDDEVNHARSPRRSPGADKDEDQYFNSAPEIRDVFGDSDDEEQAEDEARKQIGDDRNQSPMDEERNYEDELRPEDIIPDEDAPYDSEDEHTQAKLKEKPAGPPLELEIPLCQPPALSDKMNMIKVSNIMGVDSKPFDPHTYVEEDIYVTDESGSKKRIRLENNVVRWRKVKNSDGTASIESNARFVEWSDGSLQLLIGNEVLNISKQDAQHEQAHLFIRHGKGILQSQGRILTKMRFMPSSLSSISHRMLTALVESRHKKVYKVKNCITDIDPEKEKEKKEKALSQSIKASELLSRKKEKVNRKYTQPIRRERQLSPGFLEDALDEEDEQDYYEPRRSAVQRRFDDDLELEARAEKRMINAKKGRGPKDIHRKVALPAAKSSRRPIDFSESEKESEYETEGEYEGTPQHRNDDDAEHDYAEEDEEREQGEDEETYAESEEEAEEPKQKMRDPRGNLKRKDIESEEDSPPRKHSTSHRRMKMVYESDDE